MKFYISIKKLRFLFSLSLIILLVNTDVICLNEKIRSNSRSLESLLKNWKNNKSELNKFINILKSKKHITTRYNNNYDDNEYDNNKNNKFHQTEEESDSSAANPFDIVKLNHINDKTEKIEIDLKQNDPLKFMKMKEELSDIYLSKNTRFKQKSTQALKDDPYDPKNNPTIPEPKSPDFLTTKPSNIGKNGDPVLKETHSDEEVVKISKVEATSIFKDIKNNRQEFYFPDRILSDGGEKFWCSEGNHDFYQDVKFYITFPKSHRLNAMWIHWAFAPAEYKLSYSNDEARSDFTNFELISNGYQQTVKNGDLNWWKSVLSNSKTRWKYKSFDQRIDFDEPFWARIIEISMRIPVNQYYGIYKLEFYMKSNEVVMIKSKKTGDELCLTVVNGQLSNSSPVVALDCLQAISYGDNRDLFVLNSNGYITTFRDGKCLESSAQNRVDILDCGISSQYKDEREKWIMEFDGKIRSSKEEFTCLSVSDQSVSDEIPSEDMKVSASSVQADGLHPATKAVSEDVTIYWASDPSLNDVIFEIYFHKYSYLARDMTVYWKFPAKSFKIIGLYPDGYWKVFKKTKNNRDDTSYVNLMNKDLMGIKIVMMESTTKIEEKNVYGIKNISIHTGSKYLRRDPCKDILLDANKFELISVNILDKVTGDEFKRSKAALHQTRTKLKIVENMYQKVPDSIIRMKETATNILQKLNFLSTSFIDIKNRLNLFSEFMAMENFKIFTLAANEYFPAMDCANIIKSFPSKRSGMYWIKNECMGKALQVYCDFDSYDKKGGLDYYIFNDNQPINTPFKKKFKSFLDLRYKCNQLGLEPMEIKNDAMLNKIFNLLKLFKYDLSTETIIPIAYDYNCDVSKCSNLFKPFNDINSGDISDLITSFVKFNGGKDINYLFSSGMGGDPNNVKNIAAFGKLNNIIYDKLDSSSVAAILCSTNKDGKKQVKNYIDVDCSGHLRTDAFSSYEIFSNLRMICPSDCSKEKVAVYGTGIYTDNSSVCRAAIHSGAITDSEGGIVEVRIEPGKKNYLGSTKHNIETIDNPSPWDKSFTVSKFNPYCPIDKMKEYTEPNTLGSFLELEDNSDNNSASNNSNLTAKGLNLLDVQNLAGNPMLLENMMVNLKNGKLSDSNDSSNNNDYRSENSLVSDLEESVKEIRRRISEQNEDEQSKSLDSELALLQNLHKASDEQDLRKNRIPFNKRLNNNSKNNQSQSSNSNSYDAFEIDKLLRLNSHNNNLNINDDIENNVNKSLDEMLTEKLSEITSAKNKKQQIDEYKKQLIKEENIQKEKKVSEYLLKNNNNNNKNRSSNNSKKSNNNNNSELIKQLEKVIKDFSPKKSSAEASPANEAEDSDKSSKLHSQVIEKLGQLSRFIQEDLSNKMQFTEASQAENTSEKNVANVNAHVGPEILDKLQSLSNSNSINTMNNSNSSNQNLIEKIANKIHNQSLRQNQNPNTDTYTRMAIMKKLSELANEDEEKKKFKDILGFSSPVSQQTTEQALSFINAAYTKEENNFKQIKKVADDFKTLIGKAISEIGLLNTHKELGIEPQKTKLKELTKKTSEINKILFEVDKKIQNKIRRTEYNLKMAKYKISQFLIRNEFTETYQTDIFTVYSVFNSKKGKGKPSKWEYYPYNIGGHFKVIKQENAFMDNRSGSNLILRDRDYYDFELKCSFFLKDNNTFGIAFRYVDPYNYYLFEVSNQEKGYKRIRKFVKGIPKVIDFKNDGGFLQETWYNVKIRAQQSEISIYMTDRTGENMEKLYELQFKVIDNELVHGTIGFTSFGLNFMLLDNISVVPVQCTNFDDSDRDKQIAITPTCPRFFENFKNGFSERWKVYDPKDHIDGPSEWRVQNDYEYRELVLKQSSTIYGSNENQEGTLFVMTDPKKECNSGRFSLKFKGLQAGIVGFVFRFEKVGDDTFNYYILELSGDPHDKFIRIRKKINNQFSLVAVNPLLGYKKNTWMRLSLTLKGDRFNAFVSEDASPDTVIKVFEKNVVDSDLKYGNLGLASYKTGLVMDEIVLSPFDNLDDYDPDKTLYVDQEVLDCKFSFFSFFVIV